MEDFFDGYLNVVKSTIRNKRLHKPICDELESHLREKADFYVEIGYDELTAKRKSLEEMGDPIRVAENMGKLHNLSVKQYIVLIIYYIAVAANATANFIFFTEGVNYGLVIFKNFLLVAVLMLFGIYLSVSYKRITPAVVSAINLITGIPCIWWLSLVVVHLSYGNLQSLASKMLAADYLDVGYQEPSGLTFALFGLIVVFYVVTLVLTVRYNYSITKSCGRLKTIFYIVSAILIFVFAVTFEITYREVERQELITAQSFAAIRADFLNYIENEGKSLDGKAEDVLDRFPNVSFDTSIRSDGNGGEITQLRAKQGAAVLEFDIRENESFSAKLYFDEENYSSVNVLSIISRKSVRNHKDYLLITSDALAAVNNEFELITNDDTIAQTVHMFKELNCLSLQYGYNKDDDMRVLHIRSFGPESLFYDTNDFYITEESGCIVMKDSILN